MKICIGDLIGITGVSETGKAREVREDVVMVEFDYCNLILGVPKDKCYVISSIASPLDTDVDTPAKSADPIDNAVEESMLRETEGHIPDPLFSGNIHFIPFAFHLVPVEGLAKVAAVMRKGERKGRSGWEKVPVNEHINHAIAHLLGYLSGRRDHSHLANSGCRILMALSLDKTESWPRVDPEE